MNVFSKAKGRDSEPACVPAKLPSPPAGLGNLCPVTPHLLSGGQSPAPELPGTQRRRKSNSFRDKEGKTDTV